MNLKNFFENLKTISYAASFGTDSINESKKYRYAKYLKRMKAISVREDKGKELAEQLTGRTDIGVHVDPTFLLTAEDWGKVEKRPQMYRDEKYILKYFLGEKNSELNQQLEKYAATHRLQIIDVISPDSPYYNIGPSEFLYLERNAELIVTDSFHSCVFAIIYQRPFIVAERKEKNLQGMGSRIDTLLKKFCLEDRKYHCNNFEKIKFDGIDFNKINKIIEQERKESFRYLKKYI